MLLNKKNNFDDFGYMIDCSRGAVPTIESLKKLVDILSAFGYNYLMLYTEDTYEIEGEPYFGYMRGRYTKAEMKEIDEFAEILGITVMVQRKCGNVLIYLFLSVEKHRFCLKKRCFSFMLTLCINMFNMCCAFTDFNMKCKIVNKTV